MRLRLHSLARPSLVSKLDVGFGTHFYPSVEMAAAALATHQNEHLGDTHDPARVAVVARDLVRHLLESQ